MGFRVLAVITLNVFFQLCCSYQKYSDKPIKLESYSLCASKRIIKPLFDLIRPPEIVLGRGEESAVIITQTWNSTSASRISSSCTFNVKSSVPNSVFFIAITKLKFRKTKDGCYDFVQFKNGGSESPKICETIGAEYGQVHPIFGRRVNTFKVHVDVEKDVAFNNHLELEMVITAGHQCPLKLHDEFQCDENDRLSCISKSFVNDGIVNCFPPCRDEGDCVPAIKSIPDPDVSRIALTAITSLIFTMIAVGTCAWLCWKYKDCIKRGGTPENEVPTDATIELPQTSQESHANNTQSLPLTPSNDLPPSYETLFPNK